MDQFIAKHTDVIEGTLSCFDRLIFRGYLPFFSGYAMAAFLQAQHVHRWDLTAAPGRLRLNPCRQITSSCRGPRKG